MKKSFIYIAALSIIAACNKVESPIPSQDSDIITAHIEQETATKTYMDAQNNIRWSEGDQVVAFMKSTLGLRYQVKEASVGNTSGYFYKVSTPTDDLGAGMELDHNVVYYPYSETVKMEKSGANYILNVTLPSEQTYAAESFGNASMAMVAVSEDNDITFCNVLGGMKLQLRGTQKVKSIKLQGNNGEKLSGPATVTAYADETKPAITMSSSAATSVSLNCGSGVQLSESTATEFIISLPPVLFSEGFSITITDIDSKTYSIDTDKANTVIRSSLLVMPEVLLESEFGNEPQEGDYIDEYGINHGQGVKIGETVWAPVNCGYHATDYKYGKLYQWGRKYGQGYSGVIYDGDYDQTYSDITTPSIEAGTVSLITANTKSNEDVFYSGNYDWLEYTNDKIWNYGTESDPIKTEYDPCPDGWRVPTCAEFQALTANSSSWTTNSEGQDGRWLSGPYMYSPDVPQAFFSASGYIAPLDAKATYRQVYGLYFSSKANEMTSDAYGLRFYYDNVLGVNQFARAVGSSVRCVKDDSDLVLVESLTLDRTSIELTAGGFKMLSAEILPSNANHSVAFWCTDDSTIATVDETGKVTAISAGTATITAVAGMYSSTCSVTVLPAQEGDYIDEYGINHGKGVKIGETVWAPVNCGYHATDFKYGKLYQWGRKYGQGYSGEFYDADWGQTCSESYVPELVNGPVSLETGQSKDNENKFYYNSSSPYDWCSPQDDKLWNSGTEENPEKTEYDPCPEGWRVPTYAELDNLEDNYSSWTTDENGQNGYWFSGSCPYTETTPRVFFPAAGYCNYYGDGKAGGRGSVGSYWSSRPNGFYSDELRFDDGWIDMFLLINRSTGSSVRCVQK